MDEDDLQIDEVPEEDLFGRNRYLAKCQELRISPVSQVLKFLESQEMHITHYGLGLKGTQALLSAMELNRTITILRLTHNNIPDEGICALAEGLVARKHKTVTEIDVSGNRLQAKGAKALANMLGQRGTILKCLNLSHMHLGDKDATPLLLSLENNTSLKTNNCLQELILSWNKLRPKGVIAIAESLKPNMALQVLGLAWCGVQDAGALALGTTLKSNQGLVDVDLSGNGITSEGAIALAQGVAASQSLAAVLLDNNDIREDGGKAMLKAVQENKGLVACQMENTNTSPQLRSAVEALLSPRVPQ
ncbi:flagellar associated protein [Dunaliella salina]|uniref:Flagellar associated protein n=1 Tax=Dunaliella salina TaxID=3046 RepID=A0ABQ7FZH2_DUNSA|nr:flagellar associated protein [Dunaliella salina]|eukprot:KAF5827747.1 flagellar associated protein [Dunaliella salina]